MLLVGRGHVRRLYHRASEFPYQYKLTDDVTVRSRSGAKGRSLVMHWTTANVWTLGRWSDAQGALTRGGGRDRTRTYDLADVNRAL